MRTNAWLDRDLKPNTTVRDATALGVLVPNGVPPDAKARLFELQGDNGTEFWLTFEDFYVITRYNHSHLYALAVHHIAEGVRALREGGDV